MTAPARAGAHIDHQVPTGIRLAYGFGSVADGVKNVTFNAFLVLYYTTVLGLPGTFSGLAIFIALCVDAITDPLVGSLSDNFHSRFGRRHPFMFFAAVPMGLCLYALFSPPEGLGQAGLFGWLLTFAIGVRLFLTFYMVPSGAMAPEMTTHYDERTTLNAFRWMLGWTGSIVMAFICWTFFLADPGDQVGEGRVRYWSNTSCEGRSGFSARHFVRELRTALGSHSLRVLLAASLASAAALGVGEVLGTYMSTWFWEFRSEQLGYLSLFQIVPVVVGVALVRPISQAMDKRSASIRLALFAILWGPLPVVLRLLDLAPPNGSPWLLALIMGHGALLIAAVIQIGILNGAMVMDAIDENEHQTGERHEGLFVSTLSFTGKAVSGFGNFLGGVILDLIRFPTGEAATVGQVPPEAILRLGLVAGPGLVLFYLVSVFFMARLRLTRERYDEISTALEERRLNGGG
jgi:GPH family glycoside/pentoside/hexuronide:cation symporter